MDDRHSAERARIRDARYTPDRGFYEATEATLANLPRRRRGTLKHRVLAVSSAAAALALMLALTAPTLVQAAARLYQRLFGQVVSDIRQQQALPEDEKLKVLVAQYEDALREHSVEGAAAEVGGVTVSVSSIRTSPADMYDGGEKGELFLRLTYSAMPPFDPNYGDFSIVIDGREIPMRIDERLRQYRDEGRQTLTEAQWTDEWTLSNSEKWGGAYSTWLRFDTDSWRWDEAKALVLKGNIGGETFSIPFEYDPVKARDAAVESARNSLKLVEEKYDRVKDELESVVVNAAPVGLTGSDEGVEWAISEMAWESDRLYFTAAFGGVPVQDPKLAGMDYWLDDVTVDGMMAGAGNSDNGALKDGSYTTVYQFPLGRDPGKLPEESLIKATLTLGHFEKVKDVAFRYNWRERKVTLPEDDAEMRAWVEEAKAMKDALYSRYSEDVGYDLTKLNLTQEKDGVRMTITGANFTATGNLLKFLVKVEGDLDESRYLWTLDPVVTINGHAAANAGGSMTQKGVPTGYFVCPPLNISEFGNGDEVLFKLPLYERNADFESTNYPEPAAELAYQFTIDKGDLVSLPQPAKEKKPVG